MAVLFFIFAIQMLIHLSNNALNVYKIISFIMKISLAITLLPPTFYIS